MNFFTPIDIPRLQDPVTYRDRIMLMGSCFTEHIGNSLHELKFQVMQNPSGILFDPVSVCNSLLSYVNDTRYEANDLFELNETWHSWRHHSRFSATTQKEVLRRINESQAAAHVFLEKAEWLIITLGSSFSYRLTELSGGDTGMGVANCHRAPAQWFNKHLLDIYEIIAKLEDCTAKLSAFNPELKILYTVSPVRHLRDGVVENNRSKARLIEAVHHMVGQFQRQYYFPAYELVIDVLRDYRFYDIDLAHPNYAATRYVLDHFTEACIATESKKIMEELRQLVTARKHRAFQPDTAAHRRFLSASLEKATALKKQYPFLDLDEEMRYFSGK